MFRKQERQTKPQCIYLVRNKIKAYISRSRTIEGKVAFWLVGDRIQLWKRKNIHTKKFHLLKPDHTLFLLHSILGCSSLLSLSFISFTHHHYQYRSAPLSPIITLRRKDKCPRHQFDRRKIQSNYFIKNLHPVLLDQDCTNHHNQSCNLSSKRNIQE